jgi:hypothetical protein
MVLASAFPCGSKSHEELPSMDPEATDGGLNSDTISRRTPLIHKARVPVARIQKFFEFVVIVLEVVEKTFADRLAIAELQPVKLKRASLLANSGS